MCRNITTLRGLKPPATTEEIEAAAFAQQTRRRSVCIASGAVALDRIAEFARRTSRVDRMILSDPDPAAQRKPFDDDNQHAAHRAPSC